MKLIKFQLGGNIKNLPLTDILKFQLNQINPLTGKKPEIKGWEINNGEFDVVTAESGTKLESKEATPLMNFFKFLIPGFKLAYDQKLALKNYDAKMKALYRVRIPLLETPESIYKPKVQLAKKPLTTAPVALNKPILKKKGGLVKKHQLGTYKGGIQPTDNTRVASGRPLIILNRIPYGAGKGPAGEGPMRLFNDPYVSIGLMAMGPMMGRFKPGETPPLHKNGVNYPPPTLKDLINLINLAPKAPDNARVMGLGVHGLSRMSGKSPHEVIKIMSEKFGYPQTYPKAIDNSKPAYGWTFENPDHYRLALQLFNLK